MGEAAVDSEFLVCNSIRNGDLSAKLYFSNCVPYNDIRYLVLIRRNAALMNTFGTAPTLVSNPDEPPWPKELSSWDGKLLPKQTETQKNT